MEPGSRPEPEPFLREQDWAMRLALIFAQALELAIRLESIFAQALGLAIRLEPCFAQEPELTR